MYPMLAYWRGGHGGFALFGLVVLFCFVAAIIALVGSRKKPKDGHQE